MPQSNFERMIELADNVFAVKNDPSQLDVNEAVIERLLQIDPATVSELDLGDGPVCWVLLIPTATTLMNDFLSKKITEKELFELTPLNVKYEAIYLCSAMVLEEHRRKGIVMDISIKAIESIREQHPIKSIFVWAFSEEGSQCATAIAQKLNLPLYQRSEDIAKH